jgi:hypothetical protein
MGRRLGFGILLILVGVTLLFLFANGFTWNWGELWPLIFVLMGLLEIIERGWHGLRGGGGFMVLVGCFLLLFTLHLVPWPLRQAWPSGLILLGLLSLLGDEPSLAWAIILIGGGGFLLAVTTGTLNGGWRQFWPVILILAGLAAFTGRDHRPRVTKAQPAPVKRPSLEKPHPPSTIVLDDEHERLAILERIHNGELTVDEGAAILDGKKEND